MNSPAKITPEKTPQLAADRRVVLVVDDSKVQRKILSASLGRWGYKVLEAASAEDALEICKTQPVNFVLSDWMMNGMNGLDLCIAFRALDRQDYGYFILLTSKSEKGEVAHGLEMGADDFLTKPVSGDELRARLAAGERILDMQSQLRQQHRVVSDTLSELRRLYNALDRDLIEAKKLQQSLVQERYRDFGNLQVSLLLQSSGHVGGDLVGHFPIAPGKIGIYSIDVSGHGITSAMMTARLAGFLSGTSAEQNVALIADGKGGFSARSPSETAAVLNRVVLEEMGTDHYFTLMLANIDMATGDVVGCQAGHPFPVLQKADGTCVTVGQGGLPVGLIEDAEFENFQFQLEPGDRLLIPSDGVTECPDGYGGLLEEEGVFHFLQANRDAKAEDLLEELLGFLDQYSGGQKLHDDVSAVFVEFKGDQGAIC